MKYSKKIRGMSTALAFAFAFMVFSFSFAPKAYAAEAELSITYGIKHSFSTKSIDGMTPINSSDVSGTTYTGVGGSVKQCEPFIITDGTVWQSGIAKLYYSFVPRYVKEFIGVALTEPEAYTAYYDNSFGTRVEMIGAQSVSTFSNSYGNGYAVEHVFRGSEGQPITRLAAEFSNGTYWNSTVTTITNASYGVYFPSIRVIASESSAELDALDGVADALIEQNNILTALKGDLVAICQDIYQTVGDILIAQELLTSYVEAMVSHIENIDDTTVDIYNLLSTQLVLLETAINNNASTIEAAIEAQTAAMIAYLEEMFNTGNEVPDETYEQQQDAENILDQMESLEKPDVETIVPEIDDYSDGGVSGVMSAIFSSNLIVTMMTLSASLAFGAYVLFGKRS